MKSVSNMTSSFSKTPSADRSFSNKACGLPLGNVNKGGSVLRNRKTPSKTPGKTARMTPSRNSSITGNKTPGNGGDRFIPNRSGSQFDLAHFMFASQSASATNVSSNGGNETLSPRVQEFQRAMRDNLNGGVTAPDGQEAPEGRRIFAYQNKAAVAPQGYINPNKVLYSHRTGSTASPKKNLRHIPNQPDKVLDAPNLMDDYYLNLVDWSSRNVLAVALSNQLFLWNASTADINLLCELGENDEYVSSLSFLQDGNYLAVGTNKGDVQLWDVETSRRLRTMTGHSDRVGALAWNRHLLSSGARSGAVYTHDVRIQQHLIHQPTSAHTQEVCGLKWSPDQKFLASGGNDNIVKIWKHDAMHEAAHTFTDHTAAVKALAWCPWQPSVLATGGGTADRHIRLWNCNTFSSLASVDAQSQVCALLWNLYYKELMSAHGYPSFQLSIWKYPTYSKIQELTGHSARVLHTAMSPCGEYVVSAAADETLRIWKCFGVDPGTTKKMSEKKTIVSQAFRSIR